MATTLRSPKRGDLMVEEIKRWIAERRLAPGDKLPKEDELQELFGVSKGTAREALKSLEVQGLVTVSTGPAGGATIGEVPLDRALQLLQNYLFFRELDVAQIYAVRRLLEPELAAGAVPHLTEEHFAALERSIETCAPHPASAEQALAQRQEDLHFHDVLAAANPNMLLRFMCQVINHLLRHSVAMGDPEPSAAGHELGETNVAAHRRLLAAARRGDAEKVRKLMVEHIDEAERHVHQRRGRGAPALRARVRTSARASPIRSLLRRRRRNDPTYLQPPAGGPRHGSGNHDGSSDTRGGSGRRSWRAAPGRDGTRRPGVRPARAAGVARRQGPVRALWKWARTRPGGASSAR